MISLPTARRGALADVLPSLVLEDEIGGGAGGRVFAAIDTTSDRRVAVKLLADENLTATAADRLRSEAEVLRSCRHPNVIRAYCFHESDDMLVLITELASSETVLDRVTGHGLSWAEACAVVSATGRGLHAVHRQGFLHGDVQPSNVLFDPHGRHRLIDFGCARRWPFAVERAVYGNARYMAPEAIVAGGHLLPATDVYALGIMAYELLSGRLPFPFGDDQRTLLRLQVNAPPIPLQFVAPQIPRALAELVEAALVKDVDRRISSALQFAEGVEDFT